jgi:hypothetical protein
MRCSLKRNEGLLYLLVIASAFQKLEQTLILVSFLSFLQTQYCRNWASLALELVVRPFLPSWAAEKGLSPSKLTHSYYHQKGLTFLSIGLGRLMDSRLQPFPIVAIAFDTVHVQASRSLRGSISLK